MSKKSWVIGGAMVLIPLNSGHLDELFKYLSAERWIVLIPLNSGHLDEDDINEGIESVWVLIPLNSGHLDEAYMSGMDGFIASLNPFEFRAS